MLLRFSAPFTHSYQFASVSLIFRDDKEHKRFYYECFYYKKKTALYSNQSMLEQLNIWNNALARNEISVAFIFKREFILWFLRLKAIFVTKYIQYAPQTVLVLHGSNNYFYDFNQS